MSDERHFAPGTIPGAVGAIGLIAAAVLVLGVVCGWLLGSCDHPEPIQMIPNHSAIPNISATASAQVVATQSVRVTIRRTISQLRDSGPVADPVSHKLQGATLKPSSHRHVADFYPPQGATPPDDQGEEITIEVSQSLTAAATSSAQASASVAASCLQSVDNSHGRLGVIAATMPGILAADVELYRADLSPLTRHLAGVDMEVGVDVAGNLEAGAVGVTVGGKAFAGVYGWSRWNLSAQGVAVGAGLRF